MISVSIAFSWSAIQIPRVKVKSPEGLIAGGGSKNPIDLLALVLGLL